MVNSDFAAVVAILSAAAIAGQALTVERAITKSADRDGVSPVFGATLVSFLVTVPILWSIALLRGIPVEALTVWNVAPFAVAGAAFPAGSRLLYYEGIDRVGSSLATAILATAPAVAAVLAVPILGDDVSVVGGAGLVAIVGGCALLQSVGGTAQPSPSKTDPIVEAVAGATWRDVLFPALAAAIVGAAYVLIDFGLRDFPDAVTASAISQTVAVTLLGLGLVVSPRARKSSMIDGWRIMALLMVSGGFAAMAWVGQFVALQFGTVAVVAPLVNVYPVLVLAVTYVAARQVPRSPRLLVAVGTIVAGAALLQGF